MRERGILQHDNGRPDIARPTRIYLVTLRWEVLPNLHYFQVTNFLFITRSVGCPVVWLFSSFTDMKTSLKTLNRGLPQKVNSSTVMVLELCQKDEKRLWLATGNILNDLFWTISHKMGFSINNSQNLVVALILDLSYFTLVILFVILLSFSTFLRIHRFLAHSTSFVMHQNSRWNPVFLSSR